MRKAELKQLPDEVKALVNAGVYSLYTVKNRSDVRYVLLTNAHEIYALSEVGEVLPGIVISKIQDVELGNALYFTEVEPRPALKLNYA